jgi:hypothetical protein
MIRIFPALSLTFGAALACDPDAITSDATPSDTGDAATPAETTPAPDGWLTTLASLDDLIALTAQAGDVKYLARVAGRQPPAPLTEACYFQDMHRYTWHFEFLRAFPELADLTPPGYAAMVLDRPTRTLWGGAVRWWPAVMHPRHADSGVLGYTVYAAAQPGALAVAEVAELDATLATCIPWAADRLVFVPTDVFQKQLATAQRDALAAAGVDVVMPESLHSRGP